MTGRAKGDRFPQFPSFFISSEALSVVDRVKYWGHIIRNDWRDDDDDDDDDVQRQRCKLYVQANMLEFFRAYCTPLYTAHWWYSYGTAKIKILEVAFRDAFGMFLKVD